LIVDGVNLFDKAAFKIREKWIKWPSIIPSAFFY